MGEMGENVRWSTGRHPTLSFCIFDRSISLAEVKLHSFKRLGVRAQLTLLLSF